MGPMRMGAATTSWIDRREHYQALAREFAPSVVLTTKDHWLWRVIARLLWLASCGRFAPSTFLQDYATTLGPIQAYPSSWPELSRPLLVHECRHTGQCERLGWLIPVIGWTHARVRTWVGLAPMGLLYVLLPLPMGLSYGRLRLELDAERESWRASLQRRWLTPRQVRARAATFADRLSSAHYLWTWPRPWTRALARRAAEQVIAAAERS